MSVVLQFDGNDDRAELATAISNPCPVGKSIIYNGTWKDSGNTFQMFIDIYAGGGDFIATNSAGNLRIRIGGSLLTSSDAISEGADFKFEIARTPTEYKTYLNNVLQFTHTETDNLDSFLGFSDATFESEGSLANCAVGTTNYYDSDASTHTSGNPVVTDTIAGNNASGVNMPTAALGSHGSAWLEVGGSSVTVTVNPNEQSQTIESVTLTQQSSISIGGLTQAQSIEQITLQASGTLSLNNLEQIHSIEQVNLTQAHIISVNSIDQSQKLGQVILLVAGTLSVNDASQTQSLDGVNLTQQSLLTVDNTTQAQTLEQAVLSVIASLVINDITQAQEVEQAIVMAFNGSAASIASIDQTQNIDSVTLSQLNVVSVDNLSQSQLLQAVNFNGVVVGYLQGVLTVISAYNGSIKLTNPLTGEIRIL